MKDKTFRRFGDDGRVDGGVEKMIVNAPGESIGEEGGTSQSFLNAERAAKPMRKDVPYRVNDVLGLGDAGGVSLRFARV